MLSNETSDVATQAHEQGLEKQRCPAGILHHFRLMNDTTLALTTFRDAPMPADGCGGAIWQSLSSKAYKKRTREGCAMGSAFLDA